MRTTFGIIGYGRFGKLWVRHLARLGRVLVYDKNPSIKVNGKNISKASFNQVCRADIVFVLAPISEIKNCCAQIKYKLLPHTIVADACSVKAYPVGILKSGLKTNQPIIATHPLFGPDSAGNAKNLNGFKIAVVPVRANSSQISLFESILKKLKLKIYRVTAENHDRQMAKSQGLVHFIGRGLGRLNLRPQEIATPDYQSLLHIKDMVVHDTWQLFLDMQRYNKYVGPVREKFLFNLTRAAAAIGHQKKNVGNIRRQIDRLDEAIIKNIARRMDLSRKIGEVKKKRGIKVFDKSRERQLASGHGRLSRKEGLDSRRIAKIFSIIMDYSRKVQ